MHGTTNIKFINNGIACINIFSVWLKFEARKLVYGRRNTAFSLTFLICDYLVFNKHTKHICNGICPTRDLQPNIVLWIVTLCCRTKFTGNSVECSASIFGVFRKDWGSRFFRKVCKFIPESTATHLKGLIFMVIAVSTSNSALPVDCLKSESTQEFDVCVTVRHFTTTM